MMGTNLDKDGGCAANLYPEGPGILRVLAVDCVNMQPDIKDIQMIPKQPHTYLIIFCIYVYMYIYTHHHNICIYMHMYIYTYVCVYIHVCICIYTHIYTCMYTYHVSLEFMMIYVCCRVEM